MRNKGSVFITGGAGFIGVNLVQYLLGKGNYKITVYDNLSSGSLSNLNNIIRKSYKNGHVRFVKGDILDASRLNKAIKEHDAVVHLAAQTSVIESVKHPRKDFMNNAVGTFNVLEAAVKNKVDRFIFASSNAVIGEQRPPISEKMLPKPISPYGANKLYGENILRACFNCYGLKTVSLRFANAYGPYSDYKESVIAKFIRRIAKGAPLEIYGDGKQTRDFVHADDICQAIYLCLNYTGKKGRGIWGESFQIGKGEETSIVSLVSCLKLLFKKFRKEEFRVVFKDKRPGEIIRNYSQIDKAKLLLGYKPVIKLEDGLKDLLSG